MTSKLKPLIPILFLSFSGALIACASETGPQREYKRIVSLVQKLQEEGAQCRNLFHNNSKYDRIKSKMPLSGSATSPNSMQLSDMEPPTDDDVFLILEWESDRRPCVTKELQIAGQIDPALVSVTVNFERSVNKLISDVVDKKTHHEAIYYKDINMKISEIQEFSKSSLRSWATQLRVRLAAQHQREVNEQKAAQQRFFAQVGEVTVALAEAAVMSVVALKTAQAEMNNSRQRYLSQHPSHHRNFQQNVSRCQWLGTIWQCNSTPF